MKKTTECTGRPKLKIKRGDMVLVRTGEDKGHKGKVASINYKTMRAEVEGTRNVKKHSKPSRSNPDGGILEKRVTINVTNLTRIDSKTNKPTRKWRD